jgi:hypothetical protein
MHQCGNYSPASVVTAQRFGLRVDVMRSLPNCVLLVGHPSITEKKGWRVTQPIRQDAERNRIISRMTRSP